MAGVGNGESGKSDRCLRNNALPSLIAVPRGTPLFADIGCQGRLLPQTVPLLALLGMYCSMGSLPCRACDGLLACCMPHVCRELALPHVAFLRPCHAMPVSDVAALAGFPTTCRQRERRRRWMLIKYESVLCMSRDDPGDPTPLSALSVVH